MTPLEYQEAQVLIPFHRGNDSAGWIRGRMSVDQYKKSRKDLGLSVTEWCDRLGIALDTHKNYSAGRRPIALPVQRHIETLLKGKKTLIK